MTRETNNKRKQKEDKLSQKKIAKHNEQAFTDKERKAETVAKQIRGGFE